MQSNGRQHFGTANGHSTDIDNKPNGGTVPSLSGDIRHLIPPLGLREYWYPVCGAGRVGRKPLRVKMLGEDLCVFRGENKGEINVLNDVCPHRGARLSEGDCHFAGTVACPYHGWVFDGSGKNIAVLSEGPESLVCGKPGTEARSLPDQGAQGHRLGLDGRGEPAPIEEDMPGGVLRPRTCTSSSTSASTGARTGKSALENTMDSHVQYLHRDYLMTLLGGATVSAGRGHLGARPWFTGYGFLLGGGRRRVGPGAPVPGAPTAPQADYGEGRKLAEGTLAALLALPVQAVLLLHGRRRSDDEAGALAQRTSASRHGARRSARSARSQRSRSCCCAHGSNLATPTSASVSTRATPYRWRSGSRACWYMHPVVAKNKLKLAWYWLVYWTWARWSCDYNFSQQDMSVMLNLRYDTPEKLSVTDAEVVQWRRLVVTKHYGGRDHPFSYENRERGEPVERELQTAALDTVINSD